MATHLLLSMAVRSSESTPHLRDQSSLPIDDGIYGRFPKNHSIRSLELWKEREEPKHEFVIFTTNSAEKIYYRVERRPSKEAGPISKIQGCTVEDTITHLRWEYGGAAVRQMSVHFNANPKPDLYTIFAFCNTIRKDPDTEKYTLMQFNCYFFARTLTLLITRYFLRVLRQDCRCGNHSIKDFGISELSIDDFWKWGMERKCLDIVFLGPLNRTYLDLQSYINEMDEKHCEVVTQFGRNGKEVYDTLNRKKEEIWRSGSKEAEEIRSKEAERVKKATPSSPQTKNEAGKERREEESVNWAASIILLLLAALIASLYQAFALWVWLHKALAVSVVLVVILFRHRLRSIMIPVTAHIDILLLGALPAVGHPAILGFVVAGVMLWVLLHGVLVTRVLCTVLVVILLHRLRSIAITFACIF